MTHQEHLENKERSGLAVKKAIGTVSKIQTMIDEDRYCPEIVQQIDAAIGLLNSAKKTLVRGHLNHCLIDNIKKDESNAVDELIKIFDLK